MANPPSRPPTPTTQPGRSKLVRTIGFVLLAVIVLIGLAVLIIWLAVKPKHLVYSIEDASIHGFNITNTNHLNSIFNFVIRAHNPNTKSSIYYDKVTVSVSFNHQTVAFTNVGPFFQPHKNVTSLGVNLVARDVAMSGATAGNLKSERSGREVELKVRMKARVRIKVGVWKSGHRKLKVSCWPVSVRFSPPKSFERTVCDVDL